MHQPVVSSTARAASCSLHACQAYPSNGNLFVCKGTAVTEWLQGRTMGGRLPSIPRRCDNVVQTLCLSLATT